MIKIGAIEYDGSEIAPYIYVGASTDEPGRVTLELASYKEAAGITIYQARVDGAYYTQTSNYLAFFEVGTGDGHGAAGGLYIDAAEDWNANRHATRIALTNINAPAQSFDDMLVLDGKGHVLLPYLPVADPHVAGALFLSGTVLHVSAG
jgi:hypothetical protein